MWTQIRQLLHVWKQSALGPHCLSKRLLKNSTDDRIGRLLLCWGLKHWRSTHYEVTHMRNENCTHSMEITYCDNIEFPYHKELLLKERISSLWEQILSFKKSSYFEKGTQLTRIYARSSSFTLMCVTFSAFRLQCTPLFEGYGKVVNWAL